MTSTAAGCSRGGRCRTCPSATPRSCCSPDGSLLATSHRDGVAVFDARTLRQRFVLPGQDDGVSALAFSPDGSRLAAGYTSGTSIVWQVARQRPIRTFRGHSQAVEDVAFASGGGMLDTVSTDGQLLSWDVAGPAPSLGRGSSPTTREGRLRAVPSPDGRTVAYVEYWSGGEQDPSSKPGHIQFRDVATGRLTPARQTVWGGPSTSWEWSPDSRQFALAGGAINVPGRGLVEHNLQVWDPRPARRPAPRSGQGWTWRPSPPTASGWSSSHDEASVTIVDRETHRPIAAPIRIGTWSNQFYALSPDDRRLYLPLDDDRTQVVDLVTRKVSIVAPRPDVRQRVLSGREQGGPVRRGRPLGSHEGRGLDLGPPPLGRARAHVHGHVRRLPDAGWSAGVHVSPGPGTVDLWDAHTLGHLGTLQVGAGDQVPDALGLPDGHTLLIAHPAGQVVTWDLRLQHLLDVACDLARRNLSRAEWKSLVGNRVYRATCPDA